MAMIERLKDAKTREEAYDIGRNIRTEQLGGDPYPHYSKHLLGHAAVAQWECMQAENESGEN